MNDDRQERKRKIAERQIIEFEDRISHFELDLARLNALANGGVETQQAIDTAKQGIATAEQAIEATRAAVE